MHKLTQGLLQVSLKANDLAESITFYRDVMGLRLIAQYDPPGLAFFDLEGTRLLLEKSGTASLLYHWVSDIDAAHAELLAKGVQFESKPHLIFRDDAGVFGAQGLEDWMAFFKDPSGNLVAIATRR